MFTIVLKKEKLTSYNRLGLFILLIHLLYFTGYFLKVSSSLNYIALVCGIAGLVLGTLNITSATKNTKPRIPFWIILIIMAIAWAGLSNYWLCGALILLAWLDVTVRKKTEVIFFDNRIEVKAFPKKTWAWEDLNNVILKDYILTVDFKSDRLLQSEIDPVSYDVAEKGFNDFCQQKILGNKK